MYLSEVLTFHSRSNELESLQYYPSNFDTRDLLPTMIADLIFSSFLTYTSSYWTSWQSTSYTKLWQPDCKSFKRFPWTFPFLMWLAVYLVNHFTLLFFLTDCRWRIQAVINAYLMLSISGVIFITASPRGDCKAFMMPLDLLVQCWLHSHINSCSTSGYN